MKKFFKILTVLLSTVISFSCSEKDDDVVDNKPKEVHEYVDLGLPSGLKWATMNVGATSPEDYGDYFAWGETKPKDIYDWSTYKWCQGSSASLAKYCAGTSYANVDNKTVLEPNDDAAHVNWGGDWRMPTYDEQTELREKCTWTSITQNGVVGYNVKGPNGESIFLPAAGYRSSGSLTKDGIYGIYWSSSLDTITIGIAYNLQFHYGTVEWTGRSRDYGLSVRAVCR